MERRERGTKRLWHTFKKAARQGGNWAGAYLHPDGLEHPEKAWKWPVAYLQEGCATGEELGCGIPSHRKQGTIKNAMVLARGIPSGQGRFGLWHTFTPEAGNHQKHYGFNFSRLRQTGRGIPSYLHTYGDLKEGKDLTF